MKNIYTFILSFVCLGLSAQELVQTQVLLNWTAEEITTNLDLVENNLDPAIYDVQLLKVWYTTFDTKNNRDTASGIIVVPNTGNAMPFLAYQHGTTDRASVPSNLGSGAFEALFFGGHGYFSVAPDYLGLGEARGFHPYIHADSEAWAGVDLMSAALEYVEMTNLVLTDQLFVTGYSQGGHGAMALHKRLQELHADDFVVTASSPMSGPHNVSGIMRERILSDVAYAPGVAFLPYVVIGLQAAYGDLYVELNEMFQDDYVDHMINFASTGTNLSGMVQDLAFELLFNTGGVRPKDMLQPEVLERLQINDPNDPLIMALADNDLFNWIPDAPVRLFYCEADEQVPFMNGPFTDEFMNNLGASDVMSMSKGENLDHGGCFNPAGQATLDFFNGFLPVSTVDFNSGSSVELFPTPASNSIVISSKSAPIQNIEVYHLNGVMIDAVEEINAFQIEHDIKSYAQGSYFVIVKLEDGMRVERFSVIK